MNPSKGRQPLWETAVMAGSFILLWAWFLARQSSLRTPEGRLWPGWHVALGIALIALIVITVRRVQRLRRALRGEDDDNGMPSPFPPLNGHTRK